MFSRVRRCVGRWQGGFTLIELLTVLAIIFLLLGILMPVLKPVREMSRRTVCLCNLRVLADDMLAYSASWRLRIPLSYQTGCKQFNYGLVERFKPFGGFGAMYESGHLMNARNYYCPSMEHDYFQYDTAINPWPQDQINHRRTRMGYGARPMVCWQAKAHASKVPTEIPRVDLMGPGHAIVADIFSTPEVLDVCHIDRINVAWIDGSAAWVDRKVLGAAWEENCRFGYVTANNPIMLDESSDPATGAWANLDRN